MDYKRKIIEGQMLAKNLYDIPYYANRGAVTQIVTDYDHFPYQRFYRGKYDSSEPCIAEREAGWRIRKGPCYLYKKEVDDYMPRLCWSKPCSTVLPCGKRTTQYNISP
jgi:hypothetical protein